MNSIEIYSNNKNDATVVAKINELFPLLKLQYIYTEKEEQQKNGAAQILPINEAVEMCRSQDAIIPLSMKETPFPFWEEKLYRAILFPKTIENLLKIQPLFLRSINCINPKESSVELTLRELRILKRAASVFIEEQFVDEYSEFLNDQGSVHILNKNSPHHIKKNFYSNGSTVIVTKNSELIDFVDKLCQTTKNDFLKGLQISIDCPIHERDNFRAILEHFSGGLSTTKNGTILKANSDVSISSQIYEIAVKGCSVMRCVDVSSASVLRRKKPSLMIQGTCSNAGKSILTSAFGRILFQDGYAVAPFKAQNMALNSFVTRDGLEIGRAQAVQAQACKLVPDVRMNPLLLKPTKDTGSQVVLMGKPVGTLTSQEFISDSKMRLFETIRTAYDSLQDEFDVTVIEGAGSPGEVNLKESDIVNMRMARYAQSPVFVAGDIDRGGIYASFLGTYNTFNLFEKELLQGFLINRFRGDASLLKPADEYILQRTGVPVLGTIPYVHDLNIPEEDAFFFDLFQPRDKQSDLLDVAIIGLRHISNSTDFTPLENEPDITLRPVFTVDELGDPDLVILPGSKSVISDLLTIRESGLEAAIKEKVQAGTPFVGICGGLQMAGETIEDPSGVETHTGSCKGMGFLPLHTTMARDKQLSQSEAKELHTGQILSGYEIHHGETSCDNSGLVSQESSDGRAVGYEKGHIWLSYLHGVFDDDLFRREFINRLRVRKGLDPLDGVQYVYDIESSLNRLADVVRESVDLQKIYKIMGL